MLPCFLYATGIGLKNIHCLRTVFNVAHRLADALGNSWGLVVEVLSTLDRALPAVGSVSGGKVCAVWRKYAVDMLPCRACIAVASTSTRQPAKPLYIFASLPLDVSNMYEGDTHQCNHI